MTLHTTTRSLLLATAFAMGLSACDTEIDSPDDPRIIEIDRDEVEALVDEGPADAEVEEVLDACGYDFSEDGVFTLAEGEDLAELAGFDPSLPPLDADFGYTSEDDVDPAIGPVFGGGAGTCYYKLKCKNTIFGFLTCWYELCCNYPTGVVCDRVSP